jgi:hypothetical protein
MVGEPDLRLVQWRYAFSSLIMRFAGIIVLITAVSLGTFTLYRSRQIANETSAVTNLKTLANAEFVLLNEDGFYGTVNELIQSRFLEPRFASPISGYEFSVVPSQFNFLATASRTSRFNGRYEYFVTGDGFVRYSKNAELAPLGRAGLPVE